MRENDIFKFFKGSQEKLSGIVSEQNNFYKKMIKFNELWMHFVNLTFAATLFFMPPEACFLFDSVDILSSYYTKIHIHGYKISITSKNWNMAYFMIILVVRFLSC